MSLRKALAAITLAAIAGGAAHADTLDPKAEEVIARSRTTSSTYTIYWRVRGGDGSSKPDYNWAATFHQGSRHRFESSAWRVVADCAAGTGTRTYATIGRNDYSTGIKIAQQYCGVSADPKVLSSQWLGRTQRKFGLVDEVRITDKEGTSTYLVAEDGLVVGLTQSFRGSDHSWVFEPMMIERSVPSGDLFSRTSLGSSKVPKVVQNQGSRAEH